MKYRKSAKPIAMALASLLALQPVSALAVTFADINQVPWPGAEVSINKAADLGLVVGETKNGKSYFRPRDTVSLSESCQFVYKVMLQTKKATADPSLTEKWSAVLDTYKIQDWADPAVSFCLEKGIISIADLSSFVKNGVNMPASREQAAEMMGRALKVGVPSLSANASNTSFKDNASIAADARPYIALLNAEKVVNGDDVGNFNPKKTLNRTETAVMITNLYSKLNAAAAVETPAAPSSVSGKISDINSLYVNLDNSAAYYRYASSSAVVTVNNSSSSIDALTTLFKDGTELTVTLSLDGNKRVTKIAATYAVEETEEKLTKGNLTKVTYNDDKDTGYITIEKNSEYYVKNDDVDIRIVEEDDDKDDPTTYDLSELKELFDDCKKDDKVIKVTLTFDRKDKLSRIDGEVKDAKGGKGDVDGTVKAVEWDEDDEAGEIKVGSKTYDFDEDTDIEINDDESDWEDLLDAFEEAEDDDEELEAILYLDEDDDDYVKEILIYTEDYEKDDDDDDDKGESGEYSGEVKGMTYKSNKSEGTIKVGSKTITVEDTDDVDIEVTDGDKNSDIEDWEGLYAAYMYDKGLKVEVVVEDDEVTEITGYVTSAKGLLKNCRDDYLEIEAKGDIDDDKEKETERYKYLFTENKFYLDPDDDDEEEELEAWEEDLSDIDFDVDGISGSYDTLLKFYYDWLEWDDEDGEGLDNDDEFDLILTLDKDGMITGISGDYESN